MNNWPLIISKGADEGHAAGQLRVDVSFSNRIGIDKDLKWPSILLNYFKRSAREGILGRRYCYHNGIGTSTDQEKALELFQTWKMEELNANLPNV
ncbi:5814_t:CDS:2 [Funneliformis caledonium]|uniref:5814_t:CDS:1 n=1 Tax=Funneliformis caledonium TaxID=1117310 RepID=A0A9N9D9U1_9GLOM|nr:5814_t:CDS:2 [Funneliformis caledonium]